VARGARRALLAAPLLLAGCQQAAIPEEPVNRRPVVNLTVDQDNGPAPLTVELRADAHDPEGAPLTYRWFVGAESPEEGATLTYTFEEPGEYTAEVVVSDGELDSEPDSVIILVYDADAPEL